MKKILVTAAAALMLSAGVALAATPTAPTFSMTVKTTKVADGSPQVNGGGRAVVVDGNNVYVAFSASGYDGMPSISRSTDGGLTWTSPAILSTTGKMVRIAKAKDPLDSTKNIIAAVWSDVDGLKYSYLTNRTTTTGWSTPVPVTTAAFNPPSLKIGASPNGALQLMFSDGVNMFYATAANAEAAFTTPTAVWATNDDNGNCDIAFDSANNVYVAETSNVSGVDELYLHKKIAGNWLPAVKVVANTPTAHVGDNLSIAVYDSNNIYIAYKLYVDTDPTPTNHIWVASTTNAGGSWSKKIVTPNATVYGTYPSITVNSSKVITVVGHYVDWGPTGRITVNKSSDSGSTWSANVNVPGNAYPGSTLDAAGKVVVISGLYGFTELDPKFFTGTATYWGDGTTYFTREK